MGREKLPFKLKSRSALLKNLSERYTDFDLQAVELSSRINNVAHSLNAIKDETLDTFRLSQGKLFVLCYLFNEELMGHDDHGPTEIAEGLGVTPATITGLLDGLERDSYIKRHPHAQDRRAIIIKMTDKSRQFFDSYMPIQSRQLNDSFIGLDNNERQTLLFLLDKLITSRVV